MRNVLAAAVLCVAVLGCRERPALSSAKTQKPTETVYVIVDGRHPEFDAVSVVAGSRAFTLDRPFRSMQPPCRFAETRGLPGGLCRRIQALATADGIEPPFEPGGPAFSIGMIGSSSSDVSWRYFDQRNEEVGGCLDEVREAIRSTGEAVEDIPEWIVSEVVRKMLAAPES